MGVLKKGADGRLLAQGFSNAFRKQIILEDEKLWSMIIPLLPLPFPNASLQNVSLAMRDGNDSAQTFCKTSARNQIGGRCNEKNALLIICIHTRLDFKIYFILHSRRSLLLTEKITSTGTWPARHIVPRRWRLSNQLRTCSCCCLLPTYHWGCFSVSGHSQAFPSSLPGCETSFLQFITYCLY